MRRSNSQIKSGARGFVAILIACLLALRVAALPMVMAGGAPGPGMMAICTGAEIIYIPIGSQSLPLDATSGEGDTQHDPCPAFGVVAALVSPDLPLSIPSRLTTSKQIAPPALLWASAARPAGYHPRAPPYLWS
jgi:hypothetical protein